MEDFYIDYAQMDDIQRSYIQKKTNSHMVVTGTAGSGKSVIALHKIRQVCSQGSYAIIVYTKSLKKYFVDGINAMRRDYQENHGGETINFAENRIFYHYEWKKWRESHQYEMVDYLIVDECQDFSEDEINEMIAYGKICFLFGDADQTIMDFGDKKSMNPQNTASKLGVIIDKLYKNYRLTIETAEVVELVPRPYVIPEVKDTCVRHGEKPLQIMSNSFDEQLDKVINIIQNRSLSNVGILLRFNTRQSALQHSKNHQWSVQYVKEYFQQKGITVEYKYRINQDSDMDLDFQSSNPKIMTWWCAKGLQFKDVFVLNCDFDYIALEEDLKDKRRVASAWYVALSRTSERLYICYNDKLSEHFPPTNSILYGNPVTNDDMIF